MFTLNSGYNNKTLKMQNPGHIFFDVVPLHMQKKKKNHSFSSVIMYKQQIPWRENGRERQGNREKVRKIDKSDSGKLN